MAAKPAKLVPLPENISDGRRRQLAGLAQYKGRTEEGNKKALGNLPRRVKSMEQIIAPAEAPQIPEGMPKPPVPTMVIQVPALKTLTGKYARRVLAKDEYDLFCETWVKWFSAHPEWDKPEDEDDVLTICMETVLMFRLQKAQQERPSLDITEAYNQSFKRKQKVRENLTARRVDRVGTKASGGGGHGGATFNIAVMAGEVTPEMAAQRRQKQMADEQKQMKFLEGTVVRVHQTIDTPTKDEE